MKFGKSSPADEPVRMSAIAVEIRPLQARATSGAAAPGSWWQRTKAVVAQTMFGQPKKLNFDDRRSRRFPVPYYAGNEVHIPPPRSTISVGPSARVIQFPRQPRRRTS